jgi:hypothetical protein
LDFNPLTKTWRVYDYKTHDKVEDNDPQTKHVTELKTANSTRRPGFEFIVEGKAYRWNELQLQSTTTTSARPTKSTSRTTIRSKSATSSYHRRGRHRRSSGRIMRRSLASTVRMRSKAPSLDS